MERPSNLWVNMNHSSMPIEDVEENKAQTCKIWVPAKVQGLEKFFPVIPDSATTSVSKGS